MSELDTVGGRRLGEVAGAGELVARVSAGAGERSELASRYLEVRRLTEALTSGLAPEDMVIQSMPDASPTKWHLAHTSWFFEQFVLIPYLGGYSPLNPTFLYLFNSYYQQAGERHRRDQRGLISRPTVAEVVRYRRQVDLAVLDLLEDLGEDEYPAVESLISLGLNHEQQHQELILTDIKHLFSLNPLRPGYTEVQEGAGGAEDVGEAGWIQFDEGVREIGAEDTRFAFDNEGPRHRRHLAAYELSDRLVTNGEYLEFIEDGGYRRPELWLSLGWAMLESQGRRAPAYWEEVDGGWRIFTLSGERDLDPNEPVAHLTYFEADAYARWAGARLPTEAEWEVAAAESPIEGNFIESGLYHPAPVGRGSKPAETTSSGRSWLISGIATLGAVTEPAALLSHDSAGIRLVRRGGAGREGGLRQIYGDLWEWTSSSYSPYPGYRPLPGALGEYNGKFMCNQYVLRGGSCATPASHIRPTYRNFFPPDASWQFTGVRLARDLG